MSEDQKPVEETAAEQPAPLDPRLAGVDRKTLDELAARVAERTGKTLSGSESPDAPVAAAPQPEQQEQKVPLGSDVKWDEYDLDANLAHLYPQAQLRVVPGQEEQGPQWIVQLDEVMTDERSSKPQFNKDGSVARDKKGQPLGAGEFITEMLNGPDDWSLLSMLPGSTGRLIMIFKRKRVIALPMPQPLKKETEVEPPTDPELKQVEGAALDWAAQQGLTPTEDGEKVESGLENAAPNSAVEHALSINPPTVREPHPGEGNEEASKADAAADAAGQALQGPDFGNV